MGNLITQNSIFSNGGSADSGAERLPQRPPPDADGIQNYPILASVAAAGAGTQVTGVARRASQARTIRLEFFANAERDEDSSSGACRASSPGAGRSSARST